MRAFILTLERHPERLRNAASMLSEFAQMSFPAEMHFGLDAACTHTNAYPVRLGAKRHLTEQPLGAGDICCYQSHLSIARKMVHMGLPYCHVFEDDAFLLNLLDFLDYEAFARKCLGLPIGFVTLHHDVVPWCPPQPASLGYEYSHLQEMQAKPMLMHGYSMTRLMALTLLEEADQRGNWDVMSGQIAKENNLICYRVKTPLCGLKTELAQESVRERKETP